MKRNKTNPWRRFGKLGEEAAAGWLNNCTTVDWAIPHAMTNLSDKKRFQRKFGDVVVYKANGTITSVEVKTDDLCQFTGNIGFETWARYSKDPLSHSREKGWWHESHNFCFTSLIFVLVNKRSILITQASEAKQWCHDNDHLFEVKETNRSTQFNEGKRSQSMYIQAEEFVKECPYAQHIDIDTTKIEEFCNKDETLRNRRQIYK